MAVKASAIFKEFRGEGILLDMTGPDVAVKNITAPEDCDEGDLVFVDREAFVEKARAASVVVTKPELADRFTKTVLTAADVKLAWAFIGQKYFDRDLREEGGPAAVIHETAHVAERATIGRGVRIGARSVILANVVIERDAVIGDDTVIHPSVVIGTGCRVGNRVIIKAGAVIGSEGFGFAQDKKRRSYRIPQRGNVVVEDRVVIGANCCIDRATHGSTRIGAGTVMDNLCHVAHNVQVGEDCILTAMLCVAGSSRIGKRVITSGMTGILDHMEVGDDVVLLHKAGVSDDIRTPGAYAGTPTQPLKEYMKNTAASRRLAELRATVRKLEKK